MKKILLGTSALIGASLLASIALADDQAALTNDPKVTIGGFSTFEAAFTKSDADHGQQDRSFRNDNEIHFNIAGKTDMGLGYGAEIDLQADVDGGGAGYQGINSAAGNTNSGIVAHRTYGWVQGDNWGHLEFGSNDGVARTLKVDASNIARASGGIDGDFKYFADVNDFNGNTAQINGGSNGSFIGKTAGGVGVGANFITAPLLPVEHGPANGFSSDLWGNDDKITYYTPRFAGFQAGVSYAPSMVDRGQLTNRIDSSAYGLGTGTANDIVEGGVNYENQFDQIGLAAAATGEIGNTSNDLTATHVNNLKAWNAGAKVSFVGFSLAGSYGDWEDSLDVDNTKASYYTAGVAYETGPIGASVTYLHSDYQPLGADNRFYDISAGVDYKLAPGLTPFAEYTWYDLAPSNTGGIAAENRGGVAIIGSQLSF